MDWRSRSTRKLLGKVVTVQVDRPVGYLHGDILYPINYGFVPGLMGGDGEEQDAYILGVDTPLSDLQGGSSPSSGGTTTARTSWWSRRRGFRSIRGRSPRPSIFRSSILSAPLIPSFRNPAGRPFRRAGVEPEFLLLFQRGSGTWSFPRDTWRPGETEERTTLRELFEETGFRTRLIPGARAATEYRISPLRKQVVFFLGEVHGEPRLQAKETNPAAGSARRAGTISSAPGRKRRKSAACPDIKPFYRSSAKN